jgi:hypothetical protein
MRGGYFSIPIAADTPIPQIIGHDEDDVRFRGGGFITTPEKCGDKETEING